MNQKFFEHLMDERAEMLWRKRTLLIEDELSVKGVRRLKYLLHALDCESQQPILLMIDSPGGAADTAIELYDFIRSQIGSKVVGRVTGRCLSATLLILQACDFREATRQSWFLTHSVGMDLHETVPHGHIPVGRELENALKLMRSNVAANQRRVIKILTTHTGQTAATVRQWLKEGDHQSKVVRAPEAKRRGLIDKVL